jgi:hypothetical protein
MDNDTLPAVGRLTPAWSDLFIVTGAIAFLVVVIFLWAVVFRARKNRIRKYHHHRHRHRHSGNPPAQPPPNTPTK